jgi:hypothetical protein
MVRVPFVVAGSGSSSPALHPGLQRLARFAGWHDRLGEADAAQPPDVHTLAFDDASFAWMLDRLAAVLGATQEAPEEGWSP